MCDTVLVGLHKSMGIKDMQEIAISYDHKLSPSWCHVNGLSQSSYHWYWTNRKGCDCGTVIGCLNDISSEVEYADESSYREKWKRKGWSDGKIARALFSMEKEAERNQRESVEAASSMYKEGKDDADNWVNFIYDAIKKSNHKSVYVLLDWSPKSNIYLEGEELVLLNEMDNNELMYWNEKVAYRCNYK